ncbi:uncharacterized protein LOC110855710 [Folsomia candida]|uniref:Uncharacterized protein n=1 Tax=Folsomia candida TaxID=158441 RepID=A0A226DRX1_FOLCA|nr:uncharacterized protein LOC110855710 [Folsomia candida]OXA47417.1 hypothetical protein Fcan01_17610 [Folsomia candida]
MRFGILIALSCVAVASAGVVNVTRCGGVGTPLQTRVSGCEGYCQVRPGQVYEFQQDFMPSSQMNGVKLTVEVCLNDGFCMLIINADLITIAPPGPIYTANYALIPNDILSGQTVQLRAGFAHSISNLLEICVSCEKIL